MARATDASDVMTIEVRPEFSEALLLIEEQKHLLVLYWMHKLSKQQRHVLQVHPQGDKAKPLHGVFCVHSPMRPNPIGLTRVELLKVEGNVLFVKGLDAFEGSPIIDIKSG
jgi:tRNA (adenine37-N6)-methyltransferase